MQPMEDDNGLDLSLSLPYGGPSTSFKGKNNIGSEGRAEEADRGSKLIDDFKNFLDGGSQKVESVVGSQRSNQAKPDENLFYDLSKSTSNVDTSSKINSGGFWCNNDNRSNEVQEVRQDTSSKRKNLFDERNHQKRHEREAHLVDLHDKTRTPHISVTADEGSMAENEDVADSEAEGSTSKLVQHHGEASKKHTRSIGLFDGTKEVNGVSSSSGLDLQGLRRFPVLSEKEFKGHVSYGVPFSGQSSNKVNTMYPLSVKESNSNPVVGMVTSGYTSSNVFQVMAPASNDRQGTQQPAVPATLPLMFGYSPVQMPNIEPANTLMTFEEGSSSHAVARGTVDQAKAEASPPEHPRITPGIAAELKFGGSGSSPNLPWVSTTGPGPNGKTISGVTYKYSGTQVRVVCACHGSHMSLEEFVQHANEEQPNRNDGGSGLASFPNSNPAASAQG